MAFVGAVGEDDFGAAILNPAPADGLDAATIALADVLTPNEAELALLAAAVDAATVGGAAAARAVAPTGPGAAADVEASARPLLAGDPGGRAVVVTLGAAGALVVPADGPAARIPAMRVAPVDRTGAGDALNGALAVGLAGGSRSRRPPGGPSRRPGSPRPGQARAQACRRRRSWRPSSGSDVRGWCVRSAGPT